MIGTAVSIRGSGTGCRLGGILLLGHALDISVISSILSRPEH